MGMGQTKVAEGYVPRWLCKGGMAKAGISSLNLQKNPLEFGGAPGAPLPPGAHHIQTPRKLWDLLSCVRP